MLFLFLIDTGASMNQLASNGMTLLDCAKTAVEHFVKVRGMRSDRYFLVTCEEGVNAIKAGWKTSVPMFLNELKNLSATSLSSIGTALKTSFDLLNLLRIQRNTDNYGMGVNPW
jgi:ATP-dependent RNA helicase DDX26B